MFGRLAIGAAFFAIAIATANVATDLQNTGITNADIFGTKPLIDYLTGGATIMVAIFAAIIAYMSFRLNMEAAVSSRFQKGVELLANSSETAKVGGIILMGDAANSRPRNFMKPTTTLLTTFLAERSQTPWEQSVRLIDSHEDWHSKEWPPGNAAIFEAVTELASRRFIARLFWGGMGIDGFAANRIYLRGYTFYKLGFDRIIFKSCILWDVKFIECDFNDVEFEGAIIVGSVDFWRCKFNNSSISRAGEVDVEGNVRTGECKGALNDELVAGYGPLM